MTDSARQTRMESFVEAWINVAIGFGINFVANLVILPAFGFTSLTLAANFAIGLVYTVISVARSYIIRRWAQDHLRRFNKSTAAFLSRILK
ncbi:hypothetical protein [Variovorax sp. RKNM96]|uniref:DUF7220 family protein n=1 Tax=Variovorax sp. RKNM96 TaxID=2681552 RepID=UPI00197FA7BD|nr:hypothetical protein [Variovorax sp. RKNM96]